jgi:hypothetical protein
MGFLARGNGCWRMNLTTTHSLSLARFQDNVNDEIRVFNPKSMRRWKSRSDTFGTNSHYILCRFVKQGQRLGYLAHASIVSNCKIQRHFRRVYEIYTEILWQNTCSSHFPVKVSFCWTTLIPPQSLWRVHAGLYGCSVLSHVIQGPCLCSIYFFIPGLE